MIGKVINIVDFTSPRRIRMEVLDFSGLVRPFFIYPKQFEKIKGIVVGDEVDFEVNERIIKITKTRED